jgi:hypothetical protein
MAIDTKAYGEENPQILMGVGEVDKVCEVIKKRRGTDDDM